MDEETPIRHDFASEAALLRRLIPIAHQFREWNMDDWPHLKNNEDFRRIFSLPPGQKRPLEHLYALGRDTAVDLSHQLIAFMDVGKYPTFKGYVDNLEDYLKYYPAKLESAIEGATATLAATGLQLYSIDGMLTLARRENDHIEALSAWIRLAKKSALYLEGASRARVLWHDAVGLVKQHVPAGAAAVAIAVASAVLGKVCL